MPHSASSWDFLWNRNQVDSVTVCASIRRRACLLLVFCLVSGPHTLCGQALETSARPAPSDAQPASTRLSLVRVFSSADDVRHLHPILNRTLDIIAGAADPVTREDALKSPSAVATDSTHRVFVADPGAQAVHVFD